MDIKKLISMAALAVDFQETYSDKSNGFISVQCGYDKAPELHLLADTFYAYAAALHTDIFFKMDDKTRPCFMFYGVRVFCVLTFEEAAARGYLTEAEREFYLEGYKKNA